MLRKLILMVYMALFPAVMAMAQDNGAEPKELSGMSIVGNDDAPKSLYIVPWKGSEIGAETHLSRMSNEEEVPVDRDVFGRELNYYQVSAAAQAAEKQAGRQFFSISPEF